MPVCPTHNQCTFTANSIPFSFACGLNYIGGDIGSSPVSCSLLFRISLSTKSLQTSSITECMTLCSTTKSCASMTFVNSICYMKDTSAVASLRSPHPLSSLTMLSFDLTPLTAQTPHQPTSTLPTRPTNHHAPLPHSTPTSSSTATLNPTTSRAGPRPPLAPPTTAN
jgi:hypothetical protein